MFPESWFQSVTKGSVTALSAAALTAGSLVLGLCVALLHGYKNRASKSFLVTLALLPAMVQMVIMLVNGNLGAGVAVMGTFSLVRFRSLPGTAREIGSIFFAMALGLAMGMGYIGFAALFLILVGAAMLLLNGTRFGAAKDCEQVLRVTIPESLDYEGIFDDLFLAYTLGAELERVRTTNMGSLYELTYLVRLRSPVVKKAFLDELRQRNGNLNITCGRPVAVKEEL